MKKTNILASLIIGLTVQTSSAMEVICKNLPKSSTAIVYQRDQVQTPTGLKVTYLPVPFEIYTARPSYSATGAGERGENLKAGECGLKIAPFATKFTDMQITFVGGISFTQMEKPTGNIAGWSQLGGSCCKVFSFEVDLDTKTSTLRGEVSLSKTSVTFY